MKLKKNIESSKIYETTWHMAELLSSGFIVTGVPRSFLVGHFLKT